MQILHFCPLPLYSGLEQYALEMAARQRSLGHDAEMVVLKGSALESECAKRNVKTHIIDFSKRKGLIAIAREYRAIIRGAQDLNVIHLHTSKDIERLFAAVFFAGWPRSTNRPKVIQQNHIWISHSKKDPLHWLTHRVVDEFWCSSEPAKSDLVRFLPVPEEKIKVIKYGRNLSLKDKLYSRQEARQRLSLPVNSLIVGAIARIDQGKGIWELLHGSLQSMRNRPELHLAIIGGPTMTDPNSIEFAKKIEKVVENIPEEIKKRIHLKGHIPDAAQYLKAFDLYAQVSYKETFSLALLDAQLAECPVIGTNSGGTPEVVKDGETGWLCEPESVESLYSALERALSQRNEWPDYAAKARARIELEFDINSVMREILNRYS